MSFEAFGNAVLYTATALGLFGIVSLMVSRNLPANEMPKAVIGAAVILGAAIIIAQTMH